MPEASDGKTTVKVNTWLAEFAAGDDAALDKVIRRLESRLRAIAAWQLRNQHTVRRLEGSGSMAINSAISAGIERLINELRKKRLQLDRHDFTRMMHQKIGDHCNDLARYYLRRRNKQAADSPEGDDSNSRKHCRNSLYNGIDPARVEVVDARQVPWHAILISDLEEDLVARWPQEMQDTYNWLLKLADPKRAPREIADADGISIETARRRVRKVQRSIGHYLERKGRQQLP